MRGERHKRWALQAALVAGLALQASVGLAQVRHFAPPIKAPGFSLPGLDGERHTLEGYRGKPVLLSLWASWCSPCRHELPQFARARHALAGPHPDAVFLTVNVGESGARARTWIDQQGLDLPVLLASQRFMGDYGIRSLPTILIFDRDGRLAVLREGWLPGDDLVEALSKDLASLDQRAAGPAPESGQK